MGVFFVGIVSVIAGAEGYWGIFYLSIAVLSALVKCRRTVNNKQAHFRRQRATIIDRVSRDI